MMMKNITWIQWCNTSILQKNRLWTTVLQGKPGKTTWSTTLPSYLHSPTQKMVRFVLLFVLPIQRNICICQWCIIRKLPNRWRKQPQLLKNKCNLYYWTKKITGYREENYNTVHILSLKIYKNQGLIWKTKQTTTRHEILHVHINGTMTKNKTKVKKV